MKLKIVAEDKYKPQYANDTDACMDLKARVQLQPEEMKSRGYSCKGMTQECIDRENSLYILPGEVRKIPSGVQAAIPEGYVMKMYVRSSTGIKKNLMLANGTGIIDAGYRDEIIMALYNFGREPVRVEDGDRICQFVLLPFPKVEIEQVADNDEFRHGDRGGGIGSTGQ